MIRWAAVVLSVCVTCYVAAVLVADSSPGANELAYLFDKENKERGKDKGKLKGPFKLPGHVQLSEAQQAKVEALLKKYGARLEALEEAMHKVYTEEQEQARKAAREKAHAAGFKGKEAKERVDRAVKLSPEQKKKLDKLHRDEETLEEEIRGELLKVLTQKQRDSLEKGKEKGKGKGKGKGKEASLEHIDQELGKIRATLERLEELTETLVED